MKYLTINCLKLPEECANVREEVWARSVELQRTTSGVCTGQAGGGSHKEQRWKMWSGTGNLSISFLKESQTYGSLGRYSGISKKAFVKCPQQRHLKKI